MKRHNAPGILLTLTCLLIAPVHGLAQGTGANVNFLTPAGLHSLTLSTLSSDSNFRFGQTGFNEFSIETHSTALVWAGRFGLLGRLAMVNVALHHVEIEASALISDDAGEARRLVAGNQGFGDPRVAARWGLIGTPALSPSDWRKHRQGFQLSSEIGLRLPLGDYDPQRVLNPGYHRAVLDVSLPMVLPLDGRRRTMFLEITPQAIWFGDNDDAPLTASRLEQDALYITEFQASRRIGGRGWLSLGVQYQNGGQSVVDGVARNDSIDQWFAEAGVGLVLGQHFSLALGYGKIVAAANDARGDAWRARLVVLL